jgi:hypothetical protein
MYICVFMCVCQVSCADEQKICVFISPCIRSISATSQLQRNDGLTTKWVFRFMLHMEQLQS